MVSKLGPPWIIYSDRGKPVAILPAGRTGEVANVEGWPWETVTAIVSAANEPSMSFDESMARAAAALESIEKDNDARANGYRAGVEAALTEAHAVHRALAHVDDCSASLCNRIRALLNKKGKGT